MAFHGVINENTTSTARLLSTTSFPASRQTLGRETRSWSFARRISAGFAVAGGGRAVRANWVAGWQQPRPAEQLLAQGAGQVVPLVGAALLQNRHDQIHEVLKVLGRHDAAQIEAVDVGFLDPGDQIVRHLLGRTDDRRVAGAQPHPANYSSQRPRLRAHYRQGLDRRVDRVILDVTDRLVLLVA